MSWLSFCKECGGWQWGPGPDMMDRLIEFKLEPATDSSQFLKHSFIYYV